MSSVFARSGAGAGSRLAADAAAAVGAVGLELGGRIGVGRRAVRRRVLVGRDQLEVGGLQLALLRHRVDLGDLAELGVGVAVAVRVLEDQVVAELLGAADLLDHAIVDGDDRGALVRVDVDPAAGRRGLVQARGVALLGPAGGLALGDVVGVAGLGGDREVGALGEAGDRADQVVRELAVLLRVEQDLVDVPVGVVVGEDRAAQVGLAAGGAEIAGGAADRVDGVVGVLAAVAVGVDPVGLPGRGQELHPPDGAGCGRHSGQLPEVGLDAVDRGEHLPGDPVLGAAGLVDRKQEGRDRELVDDLVRDPDRRRCEVGDAQRRVRVARAAVRIPKRAAPRSCRGLPASRSRRPCRCPCRAWCRRCRCPSVAVAAATDVRPVEIRTLGVGLRVSVRSRGGAAGGGGARLATATACRRVVLVRVERALAAGVAEVGGAVAVVVALVRAGGEGAARLVAEVLTVGEVDRDVTLARLEQIAALRTGDGGHDHEAESGQCEDQSKPVSQRFSIPGPGDPVAASGQE